MIRTWGASQVFSRTCVRIPRQVSCSKLNENMTDRFKGIANAHAETEKNLKGSVLPILARLHSEIKNKSKELSKGAVKGSKDVDKARNETQKVIELLGQHTAAFESSGGRVESHYDPYVLQRGVQHRLHKQVLEENNNREDLLAVQTSFQQFEAHVVQTIQQTMSAFLQYVGGQAERQKAMYSDMVSTTQRIPPDFEWKGFLSRNGNLLIDPSSPRRSVEHIAFPNQNHKLTQPLIAGTLERKSSGIGALKGYSAGYYVITPAKYLHEFKDDDNFRKDPTPDLSLYLPDCQVGGINGEKFTVKGKDASKGKVGGAFAMAHELVFKAASPAAAEKWWNMIREAAGAGNMTGELPLDSATSSPVESRNVSGQQYPPSYDDNRTPAVQTQGLSKAHGQQAYSDSPQSAGGVGQQHYNTPTSADGIHQTEPQGVGATGALPPQGYSAHGGTSGVQRAPGQY